MGRRSGFWDIAHRPMRTRRPWFPQAASSHGAPHVFRSVPSGRLGPFDASILGQLLLKLLNLRLKTSLDRVAFPQAPGLWY